MTHSSCSSLSCCYDFSDFVELDSRRVGSYMIAYFVSSNFCLEVCFIDTCMRTFFPFPSTGYYKIIYSDALHISFKSSFPAPSSPVFCWNHFEDSLEEEILFSCLFFKVPQSMNQDQQANLCFHSLIIFLSSCSPWKGYFLKHHASTIL